MPPAAYGPPTSPQASPPFGGGRPVVNLAEFGKPPEKEPHPGAWGAGGWASSENAGKGYGGHGSSKRIGGDPVEAADAAWVRADFRKQLLRRHHTMARAWRYFDSGMRGRLSFYEMNRGCRDLGYDGNVRTLWEALDLDRDGFVSLHEVDPKTANTLEGLAICIWASCGSVELAWKKFFNPKGKHRCIFEDFKTACEAIGYPGDAKEVFELLNIDLAGHGILVTEFDFLKLWFTPPDSVPVDARHPKALLELTARLGDDREIKPKVEDPWGEKKKEFKRLLLKSYGNFVRAWRFGLDRDHNGKLDYEEFKTACTDVGYPGPRRPLWKELDLNESGFVSLSELDQSTAEILQKFLARAMKLHTCWEEAWESHFDPNGEDRVTLFDFVRGCRTLGFAGNSERLFELLDVHKYGYLTLAGTSWLAGDVKVENIFFEDVGGLHLTGEFKKMTRSQAQRMDHLSRERTVYSTKVMGRNRGEISGARPSENASPMALRRSLSVASSMMPKDASAIASVQALGRIPMTHAHSKMSLHGSLTFQVDPERSSCSPVPGPPSRRHVLSQSLSNFAKMGGTDAPSSPMVQAKPPPHAPPGHGGFMTSKMGLARIANKDWREEFEVRLAKAS
eukprot:TRINITY_DN100584_c0_g1_i1.p1 TRINITY_DN100584_c0_g1~~TRINITY_DN100584_c0_g1_i1.p1  ORF type:complete len:620 (-),score=151.95 TRINITY_DN100584_c0_g1_i1:268-2127(-)